LTQIKGNIFFMKKQLLQTERISSKMNQRKPLKITKPTVGNLTRWNQLSKLLTDLGFTFQLVPKNYHPDYEREDFYQFNQIVNQGNFDMLLTHFVNKAKLYSKPKSYKTYLYRIFAIGEVASENNDFYKEICSKYGIQAVDEILKIRQEIIMQYCNQFLNEWVCDDFIISSLKYDKSRRRLYNVNASKLINDNYESCVYELEWAAYDDCDAMYKIESTDDSWQRFYTTQRQLIA